MNEIALHEEIAAAENRRWRWGAHDCATFALRCIRAAYGFTPWDHFLTHSTRAEAEAIMAGGLFNLADIVPRGEGHPQRGDLIGLHNAFGVWDGRRIVVADRIGVKRLGISEMEAFWCPKF